MGGMAFGLIVEGAVAILLAMTIGYCYVLNVRLKRLHADRDALRAMITDLVRATDMANGAIQGLKQSASQADQQLQGRLQEAERFTVEMAHHVNSGQALLEKIGQIARTAREAEAQKSAQFDMSVRAPVPSAPATPKARNALDQLNNYARSKGEAA